MAYSTEAKRRAYLDTPKGREGSRERQRRYNNSVKGKATKAREVADPKAYAKHRARIAEASRLRTTGFTRVMFEGMLALQDGKCAVCSNPFRSAREAHADHDHDTGKPRGVLCSKCNTTEGMIRSLGLTPSGFGERLQRYLNNPTAEMWALG